MKNLTFMILAVIVFFTSVMTYAEDEEFKLTKIFVSSGKGATTSGLDATVSMLKNNQLLIVGGNASRVYFIYDYKYKPFYISAGPTGGFFKNMPWLGLHGVFSPTEWFSFTHWSGWSLGKPEKPSKIISTFFITNSVSINIWNAQLRYTDMYFFGEYFSMPGTSLIVPISKKIKVVVSADYDLKKDEPYYNIGVSYNP